MSHFSVAVFMADDKQSIDALLAPYDENMEVEPYNHEGSLSTYNPESKWDGYSIGGRWHGMLILKANKKGIRGTPSFQEMSDGYDGAFVRDIDFEAIRKRNAAKLQPYEEAMKNSHMKEDTMRKRFPTEAEYMKRSTLFHTYATVTLDGEWHEPGKMGWWGMPLASAKAEREWELAYYDRFIKPAIENNWYMVLVDCHI